MPIGRDGQRIVSPTQVEPAISAWLTEILAEKRRTNSFGTISVELTIKSGEVDMIRYSDNVTTKVEK